jgi:hypothetical protein
MSPWPHAEQMPCTSQGREQEMGLKRCWVQNRLTDVLGIAGGLVVIDPI